jgi:hypothetical protein
MKPVAISFLVFVAAASISSFESRAADTNDVRVWLTNSFRPWLTRSYPEINSKVYPEWLHDHPPGLVPGPFTNWLDNVFPDLETETYPTWMRNVSAEGLGTNIPTWWGSVQKGRFSVSPAPQRVPTIIRGPYLQMGTTNSMVVRWRTDLPAGNSVSYGSSLGRLSRTARANARRTRPCWCAGRTTSRSSAVPTRRYT